MSRHSLEDGATPDGRIVSGESYDEWARELAPPDKLVGLYYKGLIDWSRYSSEYLTHLRSKPLSTVVAAFAKRCTKETMTILCIEESAEHCHRRILAEELSRIEPSVRVLHK